MLAPNSKYRSQIVPEIKMQQQQQIDEVQIPDSIKNGDQHKSRRNSWGKLLKRDFQINPSILHLILKIREKLKNIPSELIV